MKTLQVEMQKRIAARVGYLGNAVHLIPDENLLPSGTQFPCVGLKDGPIKHVYRLGMTRKKSELQVDFFCYVVITNMETVMINGVPGDPGILDLTDAVRESIEKWSPDGYTWENGDVDETESVTVKAEDDGRVQRKSFRMKWRKG